MNDTPDPNQAYEPVPYPRMLYATPAHSVVVESEAEEADARASGYTDFDQIDPERDGLEHMSREHLIDAAVGLLRAEMVAMPTEQLIEGIREMRETEARRTAEAAAAADVGAEAGADPEPPAQTAAQEGDGEAEDEEATDLDAMEDDALRAFIAGRDGKAPHHRLGRDKLLALAKGADPEPAPDQ